ncbi:transglutaminase-like cysteine peptidase [sulfur-oxidizing endosymbiont of Gigantopelta aegis]|uniref:transglutaminase-like cysteine peptidase n=1 Tax=sulfur-oxidizing endosymbiont of Gigantopelta aegis TaxID=2794934 RepID=UPI0018DC09E3|nr:transglutaminase-like cysteine peptidase [sulfur-oxidizing endosymbiont of Gigantopelta aegis]
MAGWINAQQKNTLYSEKKLSQVENRYGPKVALRLTRWQAFVNNNQDKTELEKLELTNDFFNEQILWTSDQKLWKQKDYWATPLETLIKAAGDCEDFTIIKYFTLTSLGVPIDRLKLTYVKALEYNQAHMVLTYGKTKRDIPLVLDNINKNILPASERSDLKPVYSFNGEGMWIQKQKKLGKRVGNSDE